MSGDIKKKYQLLADGFPQKEPIGFNLDHIPLPNLHPNPNISIDLIKEVITVINHKDSIKYFKELYDDYDIEKKYFFSIYFLEYWNDSNYESYLKNKLSENYSNPKDLTWDIKKESYSQFNDRIGNQSVKSYEGKLKEIYSVLEYIQLRLTFLSIELKRLYQKQLKNINLGFVENPSLLAYVELDQKKFRINIDNNPDEYIYEVRKFFPSKYSNLAIDSFIANSFTYDSNKTKIELLSLNFGNRNKTNIIFHKLYTLHKLIVKSPKVTKLDFARVMFLNIKSIRDNFGKYSDNLFEINLLESYLKRSVAKNIRPDIPLRA